MNYFGEDGPEAIEKNKQSAEEERAAIMMAEKTKEHYLRFFMVDFVEMAVRKVASQNTIFCANQARLFDKMMEEDLSKKESKKQMMDFENCLGKHSDSLEHALSVLSGHIK